MGRSVKAQLPLCPREQTEEYDRRVAVEALITKSTFKIAHDNETDETNGSNGTEPPLTPPQLQRQIRSPGSLIERPKPVDLSKKRVPLPTTLEPVNIERLQGQRDKLDTTLQLLVLKRAELEVEADGLMGELSFWVGICEDLKAELPQLPSPEKSCFILEEFERVGSSASASLGKMSSVQRKQVPVKDILERVKMRSMRLSQKSEGKMEEQMEAVGVCEERAQGRTRGESARDPKRHDSAIGVDEAVEVDQQSLDETWSLITRQCSHE